MSVGLDPSASESHCAQILSDSQPSEHPDDSDNEKWYRPAFIHWITSEWAQGRHLEIIQSLMKRYLSQEHYKCFVPHGLWKLFNEARLWAPFHDDMTLFKTQLNILQAVAWNLRSVSRVQIQQMLACFYDEYVVWYAEIDVATKGFDHGDWFLRRASHKDLVQFFSLTYFLDLDCMGHGHILLKMLERNGRILEIKDDPLFMLTERLNLCVQIIHDLGGMEGHRLRLGLVRALQRLRSQGEHIFSKQKRGILKQELKRAIFRNSCRNWPLETPDDDTLICKLQELVLAAIAE
jgi:hypothetical protein